MLSLESTMQDLLRLIVGCYNQQKDLEETLTNTAKTHNEAIRGTNRPSPSTRATLMGCYRSSIKECEEQEARLRSVLLKIQQMRQMHLAIESSQRTRDVQHKKSALICTLNDSAQVIPLFVPTTTTEKAPPLCGCIPADSTYIAKPDDMVAALVKGTEEDKSWILGKVSQYHSKHSKYEIDDIDDLNKGLYMVPRRRVIPLPLMRANPLTNKEALFPKGTNVQALYPQTTCFYRATVDEIPEGPNDDYSLLFEDKSYDSGYQAPLKVSQRYVIAIREPRKNNQEQQH